MKSLSAKYNQKKIQAALCITKTELLSKYQEKNVCLHKVPNLISLTKNKQDILMVAWYMMKALSEVIRTGITILLKPIALEYLKREHLIFFAGRFVNFSRYKATAKIENNWVISISYPQQLEIGAF